MAGNAQARDGRKSLAFLLTPDDLTQAKSDALAIGDIVVIASKAGTAAADSAFGDIPVHHIFIANSAVTMKTKTVGSVTTNDTYYKLTPRFLGQATGKTVTESKNVTDVTIDYDSATNNVCDGIVTKSGSISGALVTEALDSTSGVNYLKRRFDSIQEVDGEGNITYSKSETSLKDLLMIIWNARDAKVGDLIEMEIIPALFTNLSKGGQYNSSQSFDVDFSGNATDDNGFEGDIAQITNVTGLIPAFTRAAYNAD